VRIAQTNIQLYNQLRRRGLDRNELVLAHRAYELLTTLYSGYYQGDGKPFVAHGVGVASILAELGQPADIVAVGLLHGVYGNGDFGDGADGGPTPSRRAIVREAVGSKIEELVLRFTHLRLHPDTIERDRRALANMDETGRRLQVVAIVDHLEKYVDLGVLYFGDNSEIVEWTDRIGPDLIELANELGESRLAELISAAFAQAAAEANDVPPELRVSDGRRHLKLVVPRSCDLRN
jgi:(p)ppGpp synthase/HD superfamily hydrolase